MQDQYVTENTVSADFVEDVSVDYIYSADNMMTVEEMHQALTANTTGETTYTVVKGDTYNGIAYANDMSLSDLMALNPQADINRLMIGDVVNVKEVIPTVSVETVEEVTYHEAIACPVETQEDSSMYKGDSKILVQGEEGEALVEATVTYVNGVEKERDIQSSTTLREPTTTIKAVGTRRSLRQPPRAISSGPLRGRSTPTSAVDIFLAVTVTTQVWISRPATAPPSRQRTAEPSPSRAGRVPTAIWSLSPTTTGRRPITPITPPFWSPLGRRCTRAKLSPRRAALAGPLAITATSRSA